MAKLFNLARMSTATTGTGTITLGAAVPGYLTFAQAGVSNGDVVDYAIKDGSNSEHGTGTYTSSGTTLSRTVTRSTNSNSAISLSGTAEVFISPRAETLNDASLIATGTMDAARLPSASDTAIGGIEVAIQSEMEAGTDTGKAVTPGRQQFHASAAKAWALVDAAGSLTAGYNVTSASRPGTGSFTITFTTAFSNTNYVAVGIGHGACLLYSTAKTTTVLSYNVVGITTGSGTNVAHQVVVYGDQ